MKNYVKLIGIALLTAAMVLTFAGCSSGGGGGGSTTKPNTDPKTLTITNIPADVVNSTTSDHEIWIYIVGAGKTGKLSDISVANGWLPCDDSTVTEPQDLEEINLFVYNTNNKWTGNGKYDVVLQLWNTSTDNVDAQFRANNIQFNSANTQVAWTVFQNNL